MSVARTLTHFGTKKFTKIYCRGSAVSDNLRSVHWWNRNNSKYSEMDALVPDQQPRRTKEMSRRNKQGNRVRVSPF